MRRERHGDQGPRSGTASQKVSSESATTALAPDQRLRRTSVLHSSAGVTIDSHDALNYHKMELEEQTRREVAHESDATRTMTTRKSQSGEKKQTSAGDTHEPKPRIGTRSLQRVLGARNSNPIAAGDGRKGDSARVSQEVSRRTRIRRT